MSAPAPAPLRRRWLRVTATAAVAVVFVLTPDGGAIAAEVAEVQGVGGREVVLEATGEAARRGSYGIT